MDEKKDIIYELEQIARIKYDKYYKFVDIFSKFKAEVLIFYYLYNLKINLKEYIQSLVSTIYSLLVFK